MSAQISFDVAYAAYNASYIDGLEVLLSSDCGITWNSLYLKTGLTVGPGNLPTAPPTTSNFTPTSAQWRNETINLDQYIGEPSVRIAFRNLPAYGNNLYIDNINISGVFIPPPVANFSSSTPLICQGGSSLRATRAAASTSSGRSTRFTASSTLTASFRARSTSRTGTTSSTVRTCRARARTCWPGASGSRFS